MTETPISPRVARIRLEQYGSRTSTWHTATYDNGTEKALHEIALSLLGEVDRLTGEIENLETDKKNFATQTGFLVSRKGVSNWLEQHAQKHRSTGTSEGATRAEAIETLAVKIQNTSGEDVPPAGCTRCNGSGVDPEHSAQEDYGDFARMVEVPCTGCDT